MFKIRCLCDVFDAEKNIYLPIKGEEFEVCMCTGDGDVVFFEGKRLVILGKNEYEIIGGCEHEN